MEGNNNLILLDAYALIFRSYYAFIRNPRITSRGMNTSAVFGFVLTLEDIIKKFDPDHIAVIFDAPHPTFRHKMFPKYKANREKTPEDIKSAVPYVKQIVEAYGIPLLEKPGFEADDVIGTLAKKAEKSGFNAYMVTADKDYLQLLSDAIFMLKPPRRGGMYETVGIKDLPSVFHVEHPKQVIDVLALWGDSVDNIPGAPGIGEKTAKKLIQEYGSLDGLLKNVDKLSDNLRKKVEDNLEQIRLSRELVTIVTDVDISFDIDKSSYSGPDKGSLLEIYRELEFNTLAKKIAEPDESKIQKGSSQGSLFDIRGEESKSKIKTIEDSPHRYVLVSTKDERVALVNLLKRQSAFCWDTETTGLDPLQAELVGMSFTYEPHKAWWVPVPEKREEVKNILEDFKPLFSNEKIAKVGQNVKYDLHILRNYGIDVKGPIYDTMLAHYLLYPGQRHNLNMMAESILDYAPVTIEKLIGEKKSRQISMREADKDLLREYACEDSDITWQLWQKLYAELTSRGMLKLAEKIEMPLVTVLMAMERTGFRLDREILENYALQLKEEMEELEQEIYRLAGTTFNISSPKQLGVVLFEKLKITDKVKKTKTKQYSTSEETLLQLEDTHPIVNKVLEYRSVKKLITTYVEPLPLLIKPETGRIHTEFNQAIAVTGRLSSANPNLQNIPIREERGREIRKAFVPADEKHILLSADYSQIELRIMAHLSNDQEMIRAFREDKDIHTATAAKIYEVSEEEVTREMRSHAKTANFGIIYGISPFGLAQRLHIPRSKASGLIEGYFSSFPGVKNYMERSIQNAREKGYAETIFGRRRLLKDILAANSVVRGMAERNAINMPIQGSAADIIKLAMINIHRLLKSASYRSKMILQVHDELLFDVFLPEKEKLVNMVIHEMEEVVSLKVPLRVDYGVGNNWLEAH